jgi:hypothetical protein
MQILLVGMQCGLFLYQRDGAALVLLRQLLEDLAIIAIEDLGSEVLRVAGSDGSVRQSYDARVSWHPDAGSPPDPLAPTSALTTHGPLPLQNPRLRGATAHARSGGRAPILIGAGAGGMMLFRSEDDGIHWQAAQMLGGRMAMLRPSPPILIGAMWPGLLPIRVPSCAAAIAAPPGNMLPKLPVACTDSSANVPAQGLNSFIEQDLATIRVIPSERQRPRRLS